MKMNENIPQMTPGTIETIKAEAANQRFVFGEQRVHEARGNRVQPETIMSFVSATRTIAESGPFVCVGNRLVLDLALDNNEPLVLSVPHGDPLLTIGQVETDYSLATVRNIVHEERFFRQRGLAIGKHIVKEHVFVDLDGQPKVQREIEPVKRRVIGHPAPRRAIIPATDKFLNSVIDAMAIVYARNSPYASDPRRQSQP